MNCIGIYEVNFSLKIHTSIDHTLITLQFQRKQEGILADVSFPAINCDILTNRKQFLFVFTSSERIVFHSLQNLH